MHRQSPNTRTLVALAIGAALASPVAFAQVGVGGAVRGNVDAQVPAPQQNAPVPAATQAVDRTSGAVMDRTQSAIDRVTDAAERGRQVATERVARTADSARDTAQDAQQQATETTDATDAQAQGAARAAAHSNVASHELWGRLDADGNGSISTEEAAADASFNSGFAKADSDGDGSVTQAEYDVYAKVHLSTGGMQSAAHAQAATNLTWANLDADADGKLSAAEVEGDATLSGAFSAMDSDQDGAVTEAEYRSYAQANLRPSQDDGSTTPDDGGGSR